MFRIRLMLMKEFRQIRRGTIMRQLFVAPFLQLIVLSNAASFEIRNIMLYVTDLDRSQTSIGLVEKFMGSGFFLPAGGGTQVEAEKALLEGKADVGLVIPNGLEADIVRQDDPRVLLLFDAIDGAAAGVRQGYALSILQDFNRELLVDRRLVRPGDLPPVVDETHAYWFNPELNYKTFMVPGLLVMLLTMISVFLASVNIVREKEIGTIEQINVTPIRKSEFIVGKLLPFWLIGMFELTFGLVIAKVLFSLPIVGSLFTLYVFAAVYLVAVLGLGFFISTVSNTQQQAMFMAWFMMVIFILMSGLYTPIESMPGWAQLLTKFNPIAYFVKVNRMLLLKGAGFAEIWPYLSAIVAIGFVTNGLAVRMYRKIG